MAILTGDPSFEDAAKNAIRAMWGLRGRKTNLLGNTLDVQRGGLYKLKSVDP